MPNKKTYSSSLLLVLVIVVGASLYLYRLTSNPDGFFIDESSVAYNAYTISQTGKDEFGNEWPLFFPAFGDYKNPVYIYLLAAVFKITGPGILVARLLSAASVLAALVVLGLITARLAENKKLRVLSASLVVLCALLTPWFFELSRVSFEVALFPFAVALFLFLLHGMRSRTSWLWSDSISLGLALTLITYTYSVGRLLGPLFAVGLLVFATRSRWPGIIRIWGLYLLTLVPLINYQRHHSSALTARFNALTYIRDDTPVGTIIFRFLKHYVANLDPTRIIWNGDPNIYQVIHVYGQPAMLVATFLLILLGVAVVALYQRRSRWWWFVGYGTLASVVPAALTIDDFHMLRLSALPVFLFLFLAPALTWLWQKGVTGRLALTILIAATLVQGFIFQKRYHQSAQDPWRRHLFDADYPAKIFDVAIASGQTPIYLNDLGAPFIQARWYATIKKVPYETFVRMERLQAPPHGSLMITNDENCPPSSFIAQEAPYTLFITADEQRQLEQLPSEAFKARLEVGQSSLSTQAGQRIEIPITVRNTSQLSWPRCQSGPSLNQVFVGSHWLGANGEWSREEGRGSLTKQLAPGESAQLKFTVHAPLEPGTYVLELDLLQEGVAWFSKRGSTPVKITIRVS